MAALNFSAPAQATISSAYPMLLDAKVCRRLVAASCPYQGVAPSTGLQAVQANAARLGDVVVMNVGYNDSWTRYRADIDAVMGAINAANVPYVVWVNLRQVGSERGRVRQHQRRHPERGSRLPEDPGGRLERLQRRQGVVRL